MSVFTEGSDNYAHFLLLVTGNINSTLALQLIVNSIGALTGQQWTIECMLTRRNKESELIAYTDRHHYHHITTYTFIDVIFKVDL